MKRTHLAVVLDSTPETHDLEAAHCVESTHPALTVCASCGGHIIARRGGMTYCCDAAELAALRAMAQDLDRRLMAELEDPPTDPHAGRILAWLRQRVVAARRLAMPGALIAPSAPPRP